MNSKQLVKDTLEFKNTTGQIPRELWALPWANTEHPDVMESLKKDFEWNIIKLQPIYKNPPKTTGDPYAVGEFIDEWGCIFDNVHAGIIGEVKRPIVTDDDWEDVDNIHIPTEILSLDIDAINEICAQNKDTFLLSKYPPRPFEQLQFIRGTAELYMDLMDPPEKMLEFIKKMHNLYCEYLKLWAQTDVDGLFFMDDWGSQQDLLINPTIWEEIFMPMYKDYIEIAHSHGKKAFMHSDGNTLRIIPKLIEIGLDAMNTQIFCMDIDELAKYKGKITFWGEIDRQVLIPTGTPEEVNSAVKRVHSKLWANGGCIAQCEFGPGAKPENIYEVFKAWKEIG